MLHWKIGVCANTFYSRYRVIYIKKKKKEREKKVDRKINILMDIKELV